MVYYRTRVELGSTGYVAYCGVDPWMALDALHSAFPIRGEHAVCEKRNGNEQWEALVTWHGGKPLVCSWCGGTGDGSASLRVCLGCRGKGVR